MMHLRKVNILSKKEMLLEMRDNYCMDIICKSYSLQIPAQKVKSYLQGMFINVLSRALKMPRSVFETRTREMYKSS